MSNDVMDYERLFDMLNRSRGAMAAYDVGKINDIANNGTTATSPSEAYSIPANIADSKRRYKPKGLINNDEIDNRINEYARLKDMERANDKYLADTKKIKQDLDNIGIGIDLTSSLDDINNVVNNGTTAIDASNAYAQPTGVFNGARNSRPEKELTDIKIASEPKASDAENQHLFRDMLDAIKSGASSALDDAGKGLSYVGGFINDTFNGDDLSDATKARRQYALAKGVKQLFNAGANNDIDRANLYAANLGYAGRAKKPTGKDFADRLYNERLGMQAEANDKYNRQTSERYMKMLEKALLGSKKNVSKN